MSLYSILVVIIARIVFIHSFLFYWLLCSHSFKTNPNTVTNISKLFNYTAPASLFDTFLVDLIQTVRLPLPPINHLLYHHHRRNKEDCNKIHRTKHVVQDSNRNPNANHQQNPKLIAVPQYVNVDDYK